MCVSGGSFHALERRRSALRRHRAAGEVDLVLGEAVEGRFGQAEVLRQERLRDVADPVGDAERAELREVAVVEDQDEVRRLVAQAFEHVAVAAREIPDVARLEVVRLGLPCGSMTVVRTCPSMTNAHSAAVACQCSSRMAPGSSFIS